MITAIKDFFYELWQESQPEPEPVGSYHMPQTIFFKVYNEENLRKNQRIGNFRLFVDALVTLARELDLYTFFLDAGYYGLPSLSRGIDGYTFPLNGRSSLIPSGGGGSPISFDKWNMYHFDILDWTKVGMFEDSIRANEGHIGYLPRIGESYNLTRLDNFRSSYDLWKFTREYAAEATHVQTEQFVREVRDNGLKTAKHELLRRNRRGLFRQFLI